MSQALTDFKNHASVENLGFDVSEPHKLPVLTTLEKMQAFWKLL